GNLQLDLFELRLHLIGLDAGPSNRRLLRAQSERIRDVELNSPARVLIAKQRVKCVADAARYDALDWTAERGEVALEECASDAGEAVLSLQIDLRFHLVLEKP